MLRSTAAKAALALALAGGLTACDPGGYPPHEEIAAQYACSKEWTVRTDGLTWEDVLRESRPFGFDGHPESWNVLFQDLNGSVRWDAEVPVDTTVLIPQQCQPGTSPSGEG